MSTGDSSDVIRNKRQQKALAALNIDLFAPEYLAPPAPATIHASIREHSDKIKGRAGELSQSESDKEDGLPSLGELSRLFERLNWIYFQGELPTARIEYSNRMRSAGSYTPAERLIRIGRRYHQLFPNEIEDTLKHEMIHILNPRHDAAFKAEANRIGASLRAQSHPSLRRPPKYLYVCLNCGLEYPRQRRLVLASCGKCSAGGRFDKKYKLKLSKKPASSHQSIE